MEAMHAKKPRFGGAVFAPLLGLSNPCLLYADRVSIPTIDKDYQLRAPSVPVTAAPGSVPTAVATRSGTLHKDQWGCIGDEGSFAPRM